jgi:hypothetical protein
MTLLDEVLEGYGGSDRWEAARRVRARGRSGGLLLRTRVPGSRLADYHLTVELGERRTVFDPFPEPGVRGVFERGSVRLERGDGEVLASRAEPRSSFFGREGVRRSFRWDALDATYFAGYAMWNYLSFPRLLTLPEVAVHELEPWQGLRRLRADFAAGLDTHSPHQTFYFDPRGLLVRHDYVADVVGRWARAAHLCADHLKADGLVFPTRRRVLPIGPRNRPAPFPTMVWIELTELQVESG